MPFDELCQPQADSGSPGPERGGVALGHGSSWISATEPGA